MTRWGYKQTPEHLKKRVEARAKFYSIEENFLKWKEQQVKRMSGNQFGKNQKHTEEWKLWKAGLMLGNQYGKGYHHTEKARQAQRAAKLGDKNPMFGTTGEEVPFYGHHHTEEANRKNAIAHTGEKSSFWRGGSPPGSYTNDWRIVAKDIRKRDNYLCAVCGKPELLKKKIIVHHIDKHKGNNDPLNLVSVCSTCHGRIHGTIDRVQEYEVSLSFLVQQRMTKI